MPRRAHAVGGVGAGRLDRIAHGREAVRLAVPGDEPLKGEGQREAVLGAALLGLDLLF